MEHEDRKPTHIMGISLLYKCNFNCEHCGYIYIGDAEDHIIKPGYKLTWGQVTTTIKDCANVEGSYWNMNYTGGEPTLWEDNGKTFVDILIETAKGGQSPSYNTNGSYFDDYEKTREFFFKYLENTDVPLGTFISMDKFHKNYDEENGRAKSLDTLVKLMDEIPGDKKDLLKHHVVIIVTKDPNSSLPDEMKKYYGDFGITFGDFPIMPIGKAKDYNGEFPDAPEFKLPPRKESEGPGVVVLVGEDYYSGNKKIGKLGHLKDLYPKV
ncbi:radical SAM protein [Thermodesulfobacteriota bacterium]